MVSYVVNSGPRNVAPETRERVLQAIEELGYRPNATARALKRGVSETIGLIISDLTTPFFSEFAPAIEEAAAGPGPPVSVPNSAPAGGCGVGRLSHRRGPLGRVPRPGHGGAADLL